MTKKTEIISLRVYFGVLLYDALLIIGLLFVATVVYIIPYFLNADIDTNNTKNLSTTALQTAAFKSYLFSLWFLFFAWFWTRGGQTLGLKAWKAKVETKDAKILNLWHVVLRFFSSLLPWVIALFLYHLAGKINFINDQYKYLILLIGFSSIFWSIFDKDGLSLHDHFSETRIIRTK